MFALLIGEAIEKLSNDYKENERNKLFVFHIAEMKTLYCLPHRSTASNTILRITDVDFELLSKVYFRATFQLFQNSHVFV